MGEFGGRSGGLYGARGAFQPPKSSDRGTASSSMHLTALVWGADDFNDSRLPTGEDEKSPEPPWPPEGKTSRSYVHQPLLVCQCFHAAMAIRHIA